MGIIIELYEGIEKKKVFFTVIVGDYAMFRLQVQILRRYDFMIMMLILNMPGDLEGSK